MMDFDISTIIHLLKLIAAVSIVYIAITILFPPWNFPKSIPTVPFYVSFLGSYTNMDQEDLYKRYLKDKLDRYGAVKIYFASRWNILVTRPQLLGQVLKDEVTFAKSGNQKKIPYAVLSKYTGDNVISAHGEIWRLYRGLVQKGIQFPHNECVAENCGKLVTLINHAMGDDEVKSLPVSDFLQRFSLANVSRAMLGCDFKIMEIEKPSELHSKLKFVKSQIFRPLYMNFPVLDKLPIPSRVKAAEEVEKFRRYFTEQVKKSQESINVDVDSATYQLYTALKESKITEKQFTDNAMIILIAGHENPQLFFTSILYTLAKYPEIQSRLRDELPTVKNLEGSALLNTFLFETLRLLPPLGQIINRRTTRNVILGSDIYIPKGAYVGYNNFVTGRDSSSWGEDSEEFKPERWGSTNDEVLQNYKRFKSTSQLSSFHGGRRACLGERFALFESRMFVKCIVENFKVNLSAGWKDKLTPAGPICPFLLRCDFERITKNSAPKH